MEAGACTAVPLALPLLCCCLVLCAALTCSSDVPHLRAGAWEFGHARRTGPFPPCRLVAWTSPRFAWSVEVRAGELDLCFAPRRPPLVCAQQQGVRPPLHTQGVDIASALHHASPPIYIYIYIYIIHPSAYQKCLPNILMKRLRAEQNSVEFCFLFFLCFLEI